MSAKKTTFEAKMQRLEQIVKTMERGEVPLEESLKLFREGTELVASCGKMLDEAETEIKKVLPGENGEPVEVPLEDA